MGRAPGEEAMGVLGISRRRATAPVVEAGRRGRLEGRVCIVTGAAAGIGRGIAQMCAEEGALVVVTDVDLEAARSFCETLTRQGLAAAALQHDAGDEAAWRDVVGWTLSEHRRLDVLVNNAASGW